MTASPWPQPAHGLGADPPPCGAARTRDGGEPGLVRDRPSLHHVARIAASTWYPAIQFVGEQDDALAYLHSTSDRQRVVADAVGTAAKAAPDKSGETPVARHPRPTARHLA
jgi:hypothetical protein